ncbi:MAG TPA: pitrilysin family protein, partial [Bryobacteraceae bacterium]|nr:pitrilysin family protein [Bryobacteraceae bacterium]
PRIRTNFLRTLAIQRSRPSALAAEAFAKAIYGDHSYGRIYPTEAMLKAYTIDDVQRFYKSHFGAARTHVYVAGRFEPSLKQAITAAFESWESGTTTEFKVPKTTATKSFALIDRPGAAQSTIIFGLPLPPPADADYLPLVVTDSLLGGSFASRITTNIREQKGYTYSPFSSITTHYHDAHWSESADVTTAVTGAALQEIVNEIKKIRKDPPTAEELAGIKSFLAGLFVLRNSSRQGVINQLRFVDLQGLPENWLRDYVPNVLKVTPQDVQRAAETYLNPDKMALVVVGDKSKIADQLTPYSQ